MVAETLYQSLWAIDTAARLGGDEFAVLLPELGARTADRLLYVAKLQGKDRLMTEVFDDERLAISAQSPVSMDA